MDNDRILTSISQHKLMPKEQVLRRMAALIRPAHYWDKNELTFALFCRHFGMDVSNAKKYLKDPDYAMGPKLHLRLSQFFTLWDQGRYKVVYENGRKSLVACQPEPRQPVRTTRIDFANNRLIME